MDTGTQNENWAYCLIDALISQGVNLFCCAPGSRSSPLALAVANHPKANSIVHFDERGLCFHAVGYGKGANGPAVVIATSGTAIGNLLPGVMEACNDRVPLIILSADRPPELRDCGANQTCDQVKMFANFIRWQIDLPCPDTRISEGYLASTISHAVAASRYPLAGPVQINCLFREPLFSSAPIQKPISSHVFFEPPHLHPSEEVLSEWQRTLSIKRQGVIVLGSCRKDLSEAAFSLAERLKWPIFADVLSSLRGPNRPSALITHFDPILKFKGSEKAEAVIQFGDRFVSKTLSSWLERQTLEFFLHVSDHSMRQDPSHLISHRVQSCPQIFVEKLLNTLPVQADSEWQSQWSSWDESCKRTLGDFFNQEKTLSEPGLIWEIGNILSENWCLVMGSSMPIRDANQFLSPASNLSIFGNRGVSGIDGMIATACGIAKGKQRPTLAVIGDLTFLHDLTSLALVAKSQYPLVLCVINNGGGGIFSFLPISQRKEAFDEFIAAKHEITFGHAASLFGLPYFQPQTLSEFHGILRPQSAIIEITADRADNVKTHEEILQKIGTCLNLAHSHEEIPAILH